MACDHRGVGLEGLEGRREGGVSLGDGGVEAVVGGAFLGHLPHALDAIEFGRVRREAEQLDAMPMLGEPLLPEGIELVAGGRCR
jgi:hypothetical protein